MNFPVSILLFTYVTISHMFHSRRALGAVVWRKQVWQGFPVELCMHNRGQRYGSLREKFPLDSIPRYPRSNLTKRAAAPHRLLDSLDSKAKIL